MLDIKFIREHADEVKKATAAKGFDAGCIDELLAVDVQRREVMATVEDLRRKRNETASKANIEEGKRLKEKVKSLEGSLSPLEERYRELLLKVPNPSAHDVVVGSSEKNEVVKTVGTPRVFDFPVRDHVELGMLTDTIDLDAGTRVAQSGFYYIKGLGAFLELALVQFAAQKLQKHGFQFMLTPNVAKEENVVGCGFQARSEKERQIYHIEGEDLDLIGTSEITLVGQHADQMLLAAELPLKYGGFSSCYRTEAGSYGKDVRGIIRVHEFRKVEMVVFCLPEESDFWHKKLLAIEEELWQELEIPYQVVKMATGDLGNAASRKYDIEAWIPSQGKYREVTSASTTTDFQTRRMNIRYKENGSPSYEASAHRGKSVHPYTLNGTAVATGRALVAIYENFQNKDGSIAIPPVLRPFIAGTDIIGVDK